MNENWRKLLFSARQRYINALFGVIPSSLPSSVRDDDEDIQEEGEEEAVLPDSLGDKINKTSSRVLGSPLGLGSHLSCRAVRELAPLLERISF